MGREGIIAEYDIRVRYPNKPSIKMVIKYDREHDDTLGKHDIPEFQITYQLTIGRGWSGFFKNCRQASATRRR